MSIFLENPNEEKEGTPLKVMLFTHNDLDGVGCAIVGKVTFGDSCKVEYCGYNEIDEKVKNFLLSEDYENYDAVFITDISVNKEVADMIQESFADKVQLIDHHATAEWLNDYGWASVNVYEKALPGIVDSREDRMSSGTSLFFHYLFDCGLIEDIDHGLVDLVEQIRRYDTWEWFNLYNQVLPKQLNDLLMLVGRYKFVERFVENPEAILKSSEQLLVDTENKRVERYIKSRKDKITPIDAHGYHIGVVFAEQYHSELGNVLATENPEYDFIAMVNFGSNSISFRGIKEDVHVGEFAQKMGGGGHPRAAGAKIDDAYAKGFIKVLFVEK